MKRKTKQIRFGKTPILSAVITLLVVAVALLWQSGLFKKTITVSSVADGVLYVHYIDIGQGDAELITTPSGHTALIDSGPGSSSNTLVNYLHDAGVEKIDYFILTHPHEDHIGGAPAVFEGFEVACVIMPDITTTTSIYRKTLEAIEKENCRTEIAEPEASYSLDGAVITLLGPITIEDNLNSASIVAKLTYGDSAFLFTGDAEEESEQAILSAFSAATLKSDVLKAGHHGSSTSSSEAFLDAVSPTYAVISCALNNDYGHPHTETLTRFKERGITYYRTDLDGTVLFSSDGTTVKRVEWN